MLPAGFFNVKIGLLLIGFARRRGGENLKNTKSKNKDKARECE